MAGFRSYLQSRALRLGPRRRRVTRASRAGDVRFFLLESLMITLVLNSSLFSSSPV